MLEDAGMLQQRSTGIFPRPVSADAELRGMGIDEELARYCWQFPDGRFCVWLDRISETTDEVVLELAKVGINLAITPIAGTTVDLRGLPRSLPYFREVQLRHQLGATYVGLRALESATAMESFLMSVPANELADLSSLPMLRSVECDAPQVYSAIRNPRLRSLVTELPAPPSPASLVGRIEELSVDAGPRLSSLAFVGDISSLRNLTIRGSASFDLSSLALASELTDLALVDCRELRGAETLPMLPKLRAVEMVGVHEMPTFESLLALRVDSFQVRNNWVFDPGFERDFRAARGGSTHSHFDKFQRGAGGSSEFEPFRLAEIANATFELSFSDWSGLSAKLQDEIEGKSSAIMERLAEAIIARDAPEIALSGLLTFDSDTEEFRVVSNDEFVLRRVGRLLRDSWHESGVLLGIASSVRGSVD